MGGRRKARRPFGSGLALACLLGAAPALATNPEALPGTSRRLVDFPVRLTPSTLNLPASVSAGDLSRELEAAARAWSYPAVPCTSAVFEVQAPEARRLAVRDGDFRVLFRSTTWCHNERCGHLTSYPAHAAAMTTLYPESGQGPIAEADVELNGVHFGWGGSPSRDRRPNRTASLRGALVHELGHVLGLNDACPEPPEVATPRRPGTRQAGCDSAMLSGDHAQPSALDVRWLCAAYPRNGAVPTSNAPVMPELSSTPEAGTVYTLVLLSVGVLLLLRLRNARAGSRTGS
jgi:hypothetical protein